jgi:hypothetical protein
VILVTCNEQYCFRLGAVFCVVQFVVVARDSDGV